MVVASVQFVPELQYWYNKYIVNSFVNKYEIPFPVSPDVVYVPQKSFISMLFNEEYQYDEYFYKYTVTEDKDQWPPQVLKRLAVYGDAGRYFILSEDQNVGLNIFQLNNDDLILLDALLSYRQNPSSVSFVDSTSLQFINGVLYGNFSEIDSPLAKLIYVYLDYKINGNYSNYNTQEVISTGLLDSLYETYLIDVIFIGVSSNTPTIP